MNDYRATARAIKAEAIADTFFELCRRGDFTPSVVVLDTLDDNTKRLLEHAAHVHMASEETWKVVRAIVARRLTTPPPDAMVNHDGPMDGQSR